MAEKYRMDIYNLLGTKLCSLYDTEYYMDGDAQDLQITKDVSGWKEISFNVPAYLNNHEHNFRLDYLKAEHLIYLYEDDTPDVYCIKTENNTHDSKKLNGSFKANHISEELKAKNLYKYFDDDNGIATCSVLLGRALAGTGWTLAYCDIFYESDGVTQKVRSYSCDTKTGAYNMITGICALFNARAEFDGYNKTVSVYSIDHTDGFLEFNFGKNMDKLTRKVDSSKLVTRLYVEGEYGDLGYVGIDSVNPSGLPFILNFNYFRDLGLISTADYIYINAYLGQAKSAAENIRNYQTQLTEYESELRNLIGVCGYMLSELVNGQVSSDIITGGDLQGEEVGFFTGDNIMLVSSAGSYQYVEYSPYTTYSGWDYALKLIWGLSGRIAVLEDSIVVATESYQNQFTKLNTFLSENGYPTVGTIQDLQIIYDVQDLRQVLDENYDASELAEQYQNESVIQMVGGIGVSFHAATEYENQRTQEVQRMLVLMELIHETEEDLADAIASQETLEANFGNRMGSMLRDGYWSDTNYAPGQEASLYADALKISNKLAYPLVDYSTDIRTLIEGTNYTADDIEIARQVRVYDKDLGVNVTVIISAIVIKPEKRMNDTVELKSDLLDIGGKTFSTVLERVTGLADTVQENKDVYKRASVITRDGYVPSAKLNGAIDTLTSQLLSTSSNWVTDEQGNIMFTALDGSSAMMLCGAGFMISSEKNSDGSWKWRTFGTGEGFTADAIVAGFISADRIEAGSITTSHLAADVGETLDITANVGMTNALLSLQNQITLQISDVEQGLEGSITVLTDSVEMRVTQDDLSSYLRNKSDGVYVGRTNSNYESVVRAEGFDILYYENGRDNGDLPVVVWEATGEGMHATQIFLDIGFSGASSVVRQTGTTTGGMAWV